MRLNKAIAASGLVSRRAADKLIEDGRVMVNGEKAKLGMEVDPLKDLIFVNGKQIKLVKNHIYLLLNKPKGYLCSSNDPEGRPLVKDLVKEYRDRRLYTIGRLDFNSEGLIILTDDGEFAAKIGHPSTSPEKTYHARVRGVPDEKAIQRLQNGVIIDGYKTKPARARVFKRANNAWIEIALHEGKNRQVRKMLENVGNQVVKLRRIKIGELTTANLKPGFYRQLSEAEINRLLNAYKRSASTLPREKSKNK